MVALVSAMPVVLMRALLTQLLMVAQLPWWLSWERIHLQCRRPGFNPWVGKTPWRRDRLPTSIFLSFPGGSDSKESACSAGDLASIFLFLVFCCLPSTSILENHWRQKTMKCCFLEMTMKAFITAIPLRASALHFLKF